MDTYRSRYPVFLPPRQPLSVSPTSNSNPSPHSSLVGSTSHPSPMIPSSYGRGYQGLDRLLKSPHDSFSREGASYSMGRSGAKDEYRGYGNAAAGTASGTQARDKAYSETGASHHGGNQSHAGQESSSTGHAKRGSKACVACRKGKNRCESDPTNASGSCRRCTLNGVPCVFEKAADKSSRARRDSDAHDLSGEAEGRVTNLERSVHDLAQGQSQIQNALQQILSMLPGNSALPTPTSMPSFVPQNDTLGGVATANIFNSSVSPQGSLFAHHSPSTALPSGPGPTTAEQMSTFASQMRSPSNKATSRLRQDSVSSTTRSTAEFPKLPGFAPPNHRFGTYGIIPLSSAPPSPNHSHSSRRSPSSESAGSSAIPEDSLTAPIQALQALANAADQAAAIADGDEYATTTGRNSVDGEQARETGLLGDAGGNPDRGRSKKRKRVTIDGRNIHLKVRKKVKPDPIPRNPFPDVVTKGLVTEAEARELWDIFFTGCHYFVPLWDKKYDVYETYIERTPFSTNGLLAVAAKIRAGNGPLGHTFHRCLEEAQGIARSTLFGPIVRKEAVMAMLILSVWSQNGWLPCGHALRMGLDMNLHRALDKLAEGTEQRSDAEERDLVVSARIWLNCYMHDHLVSLGTGKPMLLRDNTSVKHARILLTHSMASETDMRLIAGVELVNLRIRVVEHLSPLHGKVDSTTISFCRRMFSDLQDWYHEWHAIHRQRYDVDHVLVKLLETELVYAQMWTVCVALRGCQWDKLEGEQKELAFQAKDAALRCLELFLRSPNFRAHLKYATHDQLVSVAFAAVFLLKIAILYPTAIPLPHLISQVSDLCHLLSAECFAERYALTLRLMLSNFRRKTGALSTVPGTPRLASWQPGTTLPSHPGNGNGIGVGVGNGTGTLGGSGSAVGDLDGGLQSLLSLPVPPGGQAGDELEGWNLDDAELGGFEWPTEFSPSNLPVWLQDGNFTDLGLPVDGSDSLFLPVELANMFLPSGTTGAQFSLPDSEDVGAEAW